MLEKNNKDIMLRMIAWLEGHVLNRKDLGRNKRSALRRVPARRRRDIRLRFGRAH